MSRSSSISPTGRPIPSKAETYSSNIRSNSPVAQPGQRIGQGRLLEALGGLLEGIGQRAQLALLAQFRTDGRQDQEKADGQRDAEAGPGR
ncbi:hypothetical protein VQ042_17195 [Aurantimonas sp. A2-1-M11]|uniref:hypothetical protein n=1 Tax=Aurantimonas sp. A2-1-M11 TaxID=3113712 RepID=UPI002F93085A